MYNTTILNELRGNGDANKQKYIRNGRIYYGTNAFDITSLRDRTTIGYNLIDYSNEPDIPTTPYTNLAKSMIDTKVSKIRSVKVRAGLLPVGSAHFETRRSARLFRKFIDQYYSNNEISKKVTMAFRDACIFDKGAIFVDPFTHGVDVLLPWQFGILDSEYQYNLVTKCLIRRQDFPTSALKNYGLYDDKYKNNFWCDLELLFDVNEQAVFAFINGSEVRKIPLKFSRCPLKIIYDTNPVNGTRSVSMVDELFGYQELLNNLNAVINECFNLTPGSFIVGPDSEDINEHLLTNGNLRYYGYRPGTTSSPIQIETPQVIHPEWFTLRNEIISSAYQMMGISELSAQSLKPQGLDSGKALETMENIESNRIQTQIEDIIRCQEDVARIIIDIFPEDAELVPGDTITLKKIKEQIKELKFEFISLSWLSKDPQTRLETINSLVANGLIPKSMVLELSEFGDASSAYDYGSAFQDAIEKVIENALNEKEDDKLSIPTHVNPFDLWDQLSMEINQRFSVLDSKKLESDHIYQRLTKFYDLLKQYLDKLKVITPDALDIDTALNLAKSLDSIGDQKGSNFVIEAVEKQKMEMGGV